MKKNRFYRTFRSVGLVFLALVLCGLSVFYGENAFAKEKMKYRIAIDSGSKNLGEIEPGETYSGSFKVTNDGLEDFKFNISFAPYSISGEKYDNTDFTSETSYTDIAKWISADIEEAELASGKSMDVKWTVSVPEDAHGGAEMGAVLITMDPLVEQTGGVVTTRQLAYLIYGNVDGEITKTANILENKVPGFLFNPPIIGTSLVENTGNVYTQAKYSLQVFPLFSDEEIFTNEENPEDNIIYPETKRFNQIEWEGAPKLGIFKVRQTVKIFDEESVTEKLVFLCPMWFLFIVILLIFLIIFWIISRVLKRKKEA